MNDKDNSFDAIMDIWQQGQDAFLKAQAEVADQFKNSLKGVTDSGASQQTDPMAAWQSFIKSWAPTWDISSMAQPQNPFTTDFRQGPDAFFSMLDPQKWTQYAPEQLRVMLDSIARGPQFADLMMPQQKAAEAWRESLDYQQAANDMSRVMQDAWTTAYMAFSEKYTIDDLKSGNVNEALDEWLKAANKALLEAQGSDTFLDAQKRMIRASTEIRARQRDMAEDWSEVWQIPTRTEIDDLTLMMHQLRRELREVKRELARIKDTKS
ncbi:MAG: poly(R)-hydroxyalkanoic acid synthase subunit PhaE [Pseudomonadota bacterium]